LKLGQIIVKTVHFHFGIAVAKGSIGKPVKTGKYLKTLNLVKIGKKTCRILSR